MYDTPHGMRYDNSQRIAQYGGRNRKELTIPVRVPLSSERLRPSLNGKLARVVKRITRETGYASKRRHVEDDTPTVSLSASHKLCSPCSHSHDAEEVSFELVMHLLFGCCFRIPC